MSQIVVYGADWCPMTKNTLDQLRSLGVPYEYINIENDAEAREWVRRQNGGLEKKPTVDVCGRILIEPSGAELEDALAAGRRCG